MSPSRPVKSGPYGEGVLIQYPCASDSKGVAPSTPVHEIGTDVEPDHLALRGIL